MIEFEPMFMPSRDEVDSRDDLDEDEIRMLSIYDEVATDSPDSYSPEERMLDILDDIAGQDCFVGRDTMGEIVAVASLDNDRFGDESFVNGIAVHEDFRNEGIGADFMEFLAQRASDNGKSHMSLVALKQAVGFYEDKLGFERVTEHAQMPLMRKRIA